MKRIPLNIKESLICLSVLINVVLFSAVSALAQAAIYEAHPTDVTSSSFAVVWRSSEPVTPRIEVFSDPSGINDITSQFEISSYPLYGDNPDAVDSLQRQVEREQFKELVNSLGIVKLAVHGCTPGTTYYFRIFSQNANGEVVWPETGLAFLTTMDENAFVVDSRQILVTLVDNNTSLNPKGWLVTAASDDSYYPVSSYVGDGTDDNQVYLDLSNLYDADNNNWNPSLLRVINLEIIKPNSTPIKRSMTVFYTGEFHVSLASSFEINIDQARDIQPPIVQISPPAGLYDNYQSVTLATDEAANIFYTTDGSESTVASFLYTGALMIDSSMTLKYMAVDMAGNQTPIQTAFYSIIYNDPPFIPAFVEPVDGDTIISIDTSLNWQGGDADPDDVVTYDVYLGSAENDMQVVCSGVILQTCQPALLQYSSNYYWQVVAKDDFGHEVTGAIWHFTTFAQNDDEDGDSLSNMDELAEGTDPFDPDSDKDGYDDGEEVSYGSNPLVRLSKPPYLPKYGDLDGDNDIDAEDLAILIYSMGSALGQQNFRQAADFNNDGMINSVDSEMFARVFGYGDYF